MHDDGRGEWRRRRRGNGLLGIGSCWWSGRGAGGEDNGQADGGFLKEEEEGLQRREREELGGGT
jgi:hypothetical protein